MSLTISRTNIEEAEVLVDIQSIAFQPDLTLYEDYDSSPATETIDMLKLKIKKFNHYSIYCNDIIIGGADIRVLSNNHIRLHRIFFHPTYQNLGYGSKVIKMLEELYPNAKKWSLDTPYKNYRNHHFYEKLGYNKVSEHRVSDKLILFDYVKLINK